MYLEAVPLAPSWVLSVLPRVAAPNMKSGSVLSLGY